MTDKIRTGSYWEARYAAGGNSGSGSYNHLALYKAKFLNRFVANNHVHSVAELGCGDGAQLARAVYPRYVGYDIAQSAVARCREKFKDDATKSFLCLEDVTALEEVELGLSLDVVYHLLEEDVYDEHLAQLFRMSSRFAIVYGNEVVKQYPAQHVVLRNFRETIRRRYPSWDLIDVEKNPFYSEVGNDKNLTWSNFYVYQAPQRSVHPVLSLGMDCSRVSPEGPGPRLRMSGETFRNASVQDWRATVRNAARGTVVVVPQAEIGPEPAAQRPIASGYVREIVQEASSGAEGAAPPSVWMGALRTEPDVLVSLTTIRSRLDRLDKVIRSILEQSRKPDRIVLNISSEPYLRDEGVARTDLSPFILKMEEAGLLEIETVPNTGPFRKLLPTLRREWDTNCVIVTADDDTIYPSFWLDELFRAYLKHRAIVAPRCRHMRVVGGVPRPYDEWKWADDGKGDPVKPEYKDILTFATGKDGVLYDPAFFTEDVFDPKLIEIAPTCDDMVFKLATAMTGTPTIRLDHKLSSIGRFASKDFPTVGVLASTLWSVNKDGTNDESMARLLAYLKEKHGFSLAKFLR